MRAVRSWLSDRLYALAYRVAPAPPPPSGMMATLLNRYDYSPLKVGDTIHIPKIGKLTSD